MGENTKIEWCDHTMNFWTGCEAISPACAHCYAEAWAKRAGRDFAERRRTTAENWRKPLKWNREAERLGIRYRVFTNSLADFFDNKVPEEWRFDALKLIADMPHLDWLILTKRIGNVRRMMDDIALRAWPGRERGEWQPQPNVWLGATIANREEMLRDAPKLKAVRARVRFWSVEPMLGDLGEIPPELMPDWVICGGESGGHARPMYLRWVRSLRDQCAAAGVPFLFKQWGEWIPAQQPYIAAPEHPRIREFGYDEEGRHRLHRIGKHAAGRLLDGIEHNGFPA